MQALAFGQRAHSAGAQLGAQTISERPSIRLERNCACCLCLPHMKQERVLPPPRKGEPGALAP